MACLWLFSSGSQEQYLNLDGQASSQTQPYRLHLVFATSTKRKAYPQRTRIKAFSMHEVDKYGIGQVVEMALDAVNPNRDLPIHCRLTWTHLIPLSRRLQVLL